MQDSPALFTGGSGGVRVSLGHGFPVPGIHRFSDGSTIFDVIKLTGLDGNGHGAISSVAEDVELVDGMALDLRTAPDDTPLLASGWMPVSQRLALGMSLHPDRMNRDDWVALPGIGEKLAAEIERDRQEFGDFGDLDALERVRGIGPAKLKALRPFFVQEVK